MVVDDDEVVGAVEVSGYQSTYNAINDRSYTGTYAAAQSAANSAQIWGVSAIVLAVVAAAGLTSAVLTW